MPGSPETSILDFKDRITHISLPSPDIVKLSVSLPEAVPGKEYNFATTIGNPIPGDWVKVRVPQISLFEWHPFTIASYGADNPNTIDLYIKAAGTNTWTDKLRDLARTQFHPGSNADLFRRKIKADFEGIFRSEIDDMMKYSRILMFVGGAGASPVFPALKLLISKAYASKKPIHVHVVWSIADPTLISTYKEYLEIMGNDSVSRICQFSVFITGKRNPILSSRALKGILQDSRSCAVFDYQIFTNLLGGAPYPLPKPAMGSRVYDAVAKLLFILAVFGFAVTGFIFGRLLPTIPSVVTSISTSCTVPIDDFGNYVMCRYMWALSPPVFSLACTGLATLMFRIIGHATLNARLAPQNVNNGDDMHITTPDFVSEKGAVKSSFQPESIHHPDSGRDHGHSLAQGQYLHHKDSQRTLRQSPVPRVPSPESLNRQDTVRTIGSTGRPYPSEFSPRQASLRGPNSPSGDLRRQDTQRTMNSIQTNNTLCDTDDPSIIRNNTNRSARSGRSLEKQDADTTEDETPASRDARQRHLAIRQLRGLHFSPSQNVRLYAGRPDIMQLVKDAAMMREQPLIGRQGEGSLANWTVGVTPTSPVTVPCDGANVGVIAAGPDRLVSTVLQACTVFEGVHFMCHSWEN